jgi:acyl-CoA reductase-like NAD-dependent aldehyde dehydrogenase
VEPEDGGVGSGTEAGLKAEQWQDAVFTDGQFRRPAGGGTLDVRDKASGEIFATAGLAGPEDVAPAVAAARGIHRAALVDGQHRARALSLLISELAGQV